MIGLKQEFPPVHLEQWVEQLKKDLKGQDFSLLLRNDLVEEIEYPTFHHAESNPVAAQVPGKYPYTRGFQTQKNEWNNSFFAEITDDQDVKALNNRFLAVLMKGVDQLIFDLKKYSKNEFGILFSEIGFDYIQSQFALSGKEQFEALKAFFNGSFPAGLKLNIDPLESDSQAEFFDFAVDALTEQKTSFALVNGYGVQAAGANTWQEIAFCVAAGNELIGKLMDKGYSTEKAISSIHFSIGVGSNFFFQIAKIRAFREAWATVVKTYLPDAIDLPDPHVTAFVGFMNKSVIDPYTNLLRQTTEALSAAAGGVDSIVVLPYDLQSENGTTVLAERMAINISLILKEESYVNAVTDPFGGSYAVEELTFKVAEKAWKLFQELENSGGISQSLPFFRELVKNKAALRVDQLKNNEKVLIGVNKFPNSSPEKNSFRTTNSYLGMDELLFERELTA